MFMGGGRVGGRGREVEGGLRGGRCVVLMM